MRFALRREPRGIALIIVMIVITVLGILAGGFASAMRIETKLARNTSFENELEWIGRSGVEFARYLLVEHMNVVNEPWDSLNQKWAGGPLGTNDVLELLSLDNNRLGAGYFSVKIIDLERKFNINGINDGNAYIFEKGLSLIGVDPAESAIIKDSLLDWIDRNDEPHFYGAETDDYLSAPNTGFPPYVAKNGLIDDLGELLFVRGVTPEMCRRTGSESSSSGRDHTFSGSGAGFGLFDLFTTMSSGAININTAPTQVLQLFPGIDANLAQGIIMLRAGWDGVDGTEDDVPYKSVGELINVPGMVPQFVQQLQGLLRTRSLTYEVHVEARIDQYTRRYSAVVRRNASNPRDVQTLLFHWE
ncbi:MAG: type II secretion system protein GspK [Verrucomicrobia bacterium]|nr:type II secretion system protein GspK [Verrucomicrobiota bacterium]